MKTIYKIVIACFLAVTITAPVTWYFAREYYTDESGTELKCKDDASPDINGCCPGEEYTNMGDQGFNCCPIDGGDCFPPILK